MYLYQLLNCKCNKKQVSNNENNNFRGYVYKNQNAMLLIYYSLSQFVINVNNYSFFFIFIYISFT